MLLLLFTGCDHQVKLVVVGGCWVKVRWLVGTCCCFWVVVAVGVIRAIVCCLLFGVALYDVFLVLIWPSGSGKKADG